MACLSTQAAFSSDPSPSCSSSSSFSSSSSIPQWNYEVFLSFRGEDTRQSFTDHLYAALKRNGIYTFRDDLKLERGKVIRPELLKAIEASRFSIIIFSRTYASSKWCLDELVKIVECKNKMGQTVVPVFYDVDPSEVRNQTGNFQEAFAQHEEDFRDNQEQVQKWRTVMTEVGNLSGFHLKDRLESEFIQDIVKEISSKLSPTSVNKFVGMDLRLTDLSLEINLELNDVQFVGICGMGGIGKTTLASVVHSRMSCLFEGSSFLVDVRKDNLISLQEKLLSQTLMDSSFTIRNLGDGSSTIRRRLCHKKVLVIIDDVDDVDQLEKLAGNHDWFGSGSRIIITTRDKHLLNAHGVDVVYKVDGLDHDKALQLFSLKAFKSDHPPTDYVELSKHVVGYADGLPLALEVFGSFLCNRNIDEWESALARLEKDPGIMDGHDKIMDRLQISFDGLGETYQKMFLDIACFFKGGDIDYVTKILDNNEIGIKVLIEKSLIAISYKGLWMHDLLQEMAKKIVQKDSPNELGKRSRLWDQEDVRHVLTNNLGTEAVEGIMSNFSKQEGVPLRAKAFSNMNKLKVLQIYNVKLSQGLDYLSNNLRFLNWHGYPLKSLPSSFHPDKIVVLNLCYSRIEQLWKGIKRPLNKLKFITLSHSKNLTKMPDFTWIPNLESLNLEGCTRLFELHPSIGDLKRLILLNLKDCKSLSSLPSSVKWESLEVCILAGCSKLKKFPEISEMESLKTLDVNGTAIVQFPPSLFLSVKNLEVLSFRGIGAQHKSWHLPSPFQLMQRRSVDPMALRLPSLSGLCCLKKLDLSDCNLREGALLNDLSGLSSLEALDLSNNYFVSLPTSINQLSNLHSLYLNDCKRLKSLPVLPPNTSEIKVSNCTSMEIQSDTLESLSAPNPVRHDDSFIGFNCLKLVENEGGSNPAFAMITRSLLRGCYCDIVVPGSEIPKWFSHQTEGASTKIEMTALFDKKMIGVVVCCAFVFHELPHDILTMSFNLGSSNRMNGYHLPFYKVQQIGDESLGRAHLWLQVIPFGSESFDKNQLIFYFKHRCPGIEVKKFGIRLIDKHEVEEFNQTINQYSSSTFENFNGLHQDLDNSTPDGARIEKLTDKLNKHGLRKRRFSISMTKSGAVWEDL